MRHLKRPLSSAAMVISRCAFASAAADRRADGRVRERSAISGPHRGVPSRPREAWVSIGRTVQIDYHWAEGDAERARVASAELLTQSPDVILAIASISVRAFQRETRTIPIIFIGVSEPIAQGFVASLARPGGNITGFTNLEWTFVTKWLELLREIAPRVTRVGIMFNPDIAPTSRRSSGQRKPPPQS
jgi:ABC-type uncharacterized transport system substrate-binding protein